MQPFFLFALLASEPVFPVTQGSENWGAVAEVEGQYLPLVLTALKRPEMRGRALNCYSVRVRWEGAWRVAFLGHRQPVPPDKDGFITVGYPPQNERCPDITFVFDEKGFVSRKILSRE